MPPVEASAPGRAGLTDAWLRRLGLRADAVNVVQIHRVASALAQSQGMTPERWLDELQPGSEAWRQIVDAVVVGETWLRRDPGAFDALVAHLKPPPAGGRARILCAPCATGEEPLSIGLALRDAGWADTAWRVDAWDISRSAVSRAQGATLRPYAFRQAGPDWIDRHFEDSPDQPGLRRLRRPMPPESLHIGVADLLAMPPPATRYDAVFCRNLLIYLDDDARARLVARLREWCREGGLIFVGHAETSLLSQRGLEPSGWPMSFGYHNRSRPAPARSARPACSVQPAPAPARRTPINGTPSRTATPRPGPVVGRPATETPPDAMAQARLLADAGRLDEAMHTVSSAIALRPTDVDLLAFAGHLALARGELEASQSWLQRALYLAPEHRAALEATLALAVRQQRGDLAQRCRDRLQRLRDRQARPDEHAA